MKTKKVKNLVYVEFSKMERIEDFNCDAIAAGQHEHRKLFAIKSKLQALDMMDGVLGNEPVLTSCIKEVDEAIEVNHFQTDQDKLEQDIIDDFMPIEAGQIA